MPVVTRYPSTDTAVSGTWTSPANVQADDNAVASTTVAAKNTTVEREQGNYGFDGVIPAGSTINSVAIEVEHRVTTTDGVANLENLARIGTTDGAVNSDTLEPTTLTARTYPNYARPGGGSWTRDDLLDGTFKTRTRARSGNNATSVTYEWDYIRVTVDYSIPVTAFADDFGRTSTDTWGTSSDGLVTWTGQTNPANLDVDGAKGTALGVLGARVENYAANFSRQDVQLESEWTIDGLGGANYEIQYKVRAVDADDYYCGTVWIDGPTGDIRARIDKFVGGAYTNLAGGSSGTSVGLTFVANRMYRATVQAEGVSPTTLRFRIWDPTQTGEPSGWHLTATDSEAGMQAALPVGFVFFIGAAGTVRTFAVDNVAAGILTTPRVPYRSLYPQLLAH